GLDDVEELADNGGDTAKVSGARLAVELLAKGFDGDIGERAWRIHFFGRGREQKIDTFFFQQLAIAVEGARIFREVLVRPELSGIHEDRNRNGIALTLRSANQG